MHEKKSWHENFMHEKCIFIYVFIRLRNIIAMGSWDVQERDFNP